MQMSYNNGFSSVLATSMSKKTPQKNGAGTTKTKKTPNGRSANSPNKKTPSAGGDRFIPHRGSSNLEMGYYLVRCPPRQSHPFLCLCLAKSITSDMQPFSTVSSRLFVYS